MEERRLQAIAEEIITGDQRDLRWQVRKMLLIKEAAQAGCLEQLSALINTSLRTTENYLDAYDKYVERGLFPKTLNSADEIDPNPAVYEIWNDVYDYTLHAQRYGSVDREGIIEVAREMGLKGHGKAQDIAKNPKSMTAAIVGDVDAARAALNALTARAVRDPAFRREVADRGFYVPLQPQSLPKSDDRPVMSFWARRIIMLRDLTMNTRERAFEDPDTPAGLFDACADGVENLAATRDLIKGRHEMNEVR